MTLIWLSHFIPYPPKGGAPQRSFNLLRQMAKRHRVVFRAFNLQNYGPEQLAEFRRIFQQLGIDTEFWELPVRWKSGRWWMELALAPARRYPLSCTAFWSLQADERWRRVLAANPNAVLHFDSPDLALFTDSAAQFRKVLNHHNCESAMARRRAQVEPNFFKKVYLERHASQLQAVERDILKRFNVNVVVSDLDGELLRGLVPGTEVRTVENGTDDEYFVPAGGAEEPNSLVFAGSLNWYPNISGLQFFLQQAWPLVKAQVPGARMYLAGQLPVNELRRTAAADASLTLVDTPDDIRPWIARGAVFVCPIIDGGGTRLKLLDALAMGKAIVTTSIGCEGLRVVNGRELIIADRPQELASAIVPLLSDLTARLALGGRGRSFVEREYSWRTIANQLDKVYEQAGLG